MEFKMQFGAIVLLCSLGLFTSTQGQKLTMQPSETEVRKFVNESYLVSCHSTDRNAHAEWSGPRGVIESHANGRIYQETSGSSADLFFTRVTTQDGGRYTCKTKHGRGPSIHFEMYPIRPITFDPTDAEQWASEGKHHMLRCRAQGNQPQGVTVSWKIDGRNVPDDSKKYRQTKEGLQILNVSPTDGQRQYQCRGIEYKPVPNHGRQNITLKVRTKPKIYTSGSQPVHYGVVGDWANLTCRVIQAAPKATFTWIKDGKVLSPSNTVVIHNPEDNVSILQVLVRYDASFGGYECKAANEIGHDIKRMTLKMAKKPPTPLLEKSKIWQNGATIRVDYMPGKVSAQEKNASPLPVTGIVVQYKMITKPEWLPANISGAQDNNYKEFTISGLNANVTYNVRAALRNVASQGEFSANQFTITPSPKQPWFSAAPTSTLLNKALLFVGIGLHVFGRALL